MHCFFRLAWRLAWSRKMRFQGFQQAGLRLRTDNSGNRLSPSGSSLAAANLRLAGLRSVSEFSGAEGLSLLLAKKARRPLVRRHRRAFQADQACRIARHRRRLSIALTPTQRKHFPEGAD